jgi:Ribonuclease G/E
VNKSRLYAVCPKCENRIRVRADSTFASHKQRSFRQRAARWTCPMSLMPVVEGGRS